MKRKWLAAVVVCVLMLSVQAAYSACDISNCIPMGSDLSMKICITYQSLSYEFQLVYVPDSSGFYWKMDPATLKQIPSGSGACIAVKDDLTLNICCARYLGCQYGFTLYLIAYPSDPSGLYWRMDPASFIGDPLFPFQWHLNNTGQNAFSKSAGVAGEDLRMTNSIAYNLSGLGVIVAVVDSGLEIAHEDLSGNVIPNGSYNYVTHTTDPTSTDTRGDHGTSVAGITAAVSMNGKGGRGVAPKASLKGFNALETQKPKDYLDSLGGNPRSEDVDIFNMSYGKANTYYNPMSLTYRDVFTRSKKLRGGKGSIYVKSSGNEFEFMEGYDCSDQPYFVKGLTCSNATADERNSRPEVITVGAFNASGVKSSYSTAGSNLWVSTPGGEYGTNSPAIITTDQSGTKIGYSRSDVDPIKYPFNAGDPLYNANCNYTSTFNGTSSAAPNASGSVALMLQVNPNLTRRDVKHILAKTARKIDPTSPDSIVNVSINGVNYEASQGWITNAAGYHFNNWYGFGAVNVDAAVAMASTYTTILPDLQNKTYDSGLNTAVAIPDNNAAGLVRTLDVADDLTIENLFVRILINHPDTAEVGIEITSPQGTRSILLNIRSALKSGLDEEGGVVLGSNAFYGENTKGTWTLKVLDSWPQNTGTLNMFKLNILGY